MLTRLAKVENLKHSHNLSRVFLAALPGLCLHLCSTVKLHLSSTVSQSNKDKKCQCYAKNHASRWYNNYVCTTLC